VTDSSLCTFDRDTGTSGDQFRLIYTPDQSTSYWKLNASNPGQFYYNIFRSSGGSTLDITLPYPWVTQGAVPIHVYGGQTVTVNGQTCFTPLNEFANRSDQVTLGNYSPREFVGTHVAIVPATTRTNAAKAFRLMACLLGSGCHATIAF
jgi:hypothetical protein